MQTFLVKIDVTLQKCQPPPQVRSMSHSCEFPRKQIRQTDGVAQDQFLASPLMLYTSTHGVKVADNFVVIVVKRPVASLYDYYSCYLERYNFTCLILLLQNRIKKNKTY